MKIISFLLLIGFLISGCAVKNKPDEYSDRSVVVYKYDLSKPQTILPGIPPASPLSPIKPLDLKSIWDDPSLVIFKNNSYHTIRVEIDGRKAAILKAYEATPNLYLGKGWHKVYLFIKIPTAKHGVWEIRKSFTFAISLKKSARIFYIP